MFASYFATIFAAPRNVLHWFLHLGGVGLIPLGLLDSSLIPLPGSMDIATILLAARDRDLWFYYAGMATAGSVLGGYLTYRLARKGGKEALNKKLSRNKVQKVVKTFERWGFAAIAIPAVLPPPLPLVPFLIAAGGLQYSRTKFLLALGVGRLARYIVLALLAATYGQQIISVLTHHATLSIAIGIALALASVIVALVLHFRGRAKHS